jgi:hypothetical protein
MLARSLLEKHFDREREGDKIDKIVNFLCGDSGSHDYTINRKEASNDLGLTIDKPDDRLYTVIKAIYDDIVEELEIRTPFNPAVLTSKGEGQEYSCRRALIESLYSDTEVFVTEGTILTRQQQTPQGVVTQYQDNRTFEGWKREEHERNVSN